VSNDLLGGHQIILVDQVAYVFTSAFANQIDDIFQLRHLCIHNNGRVDAKFLSHSSGKYKLGDELFLTVQELCIYAELFANVVNSLDKAAITTFSLSTSD
jgi:hypothetical protein